MSFISQKVRNKIKKKEVSSHLLCKVTSSNLLQKTLHLDNRQKGWTDGKCYSCFFLSSVLVTITSVYNPDIIFITNSLLFSWKNYYQNIYNICMLYVAVLKSEQIFQPDSNEFQCIITITILSLTVITNIKQFTLSIWCLCILATPSGRNTATKPWPLARSAAWEQKSILFLVQRLIVVDLHRN